MASSPRRESSPDRSGPSLLLLPLAVVVGIVVGLSTLGAHQDAVRPQSSPTSTHSAGFPGTRHAPGLRPALQYFGSLARHMHL